MSKTTKTFACLVAAAISFGASAMTRADEPSFYTVNLVTAEQSMAQNVDQKNRLTRFVERLRVELGVGNLGDANIGCNRCGELVQGEKVEGLSRPDRPLNSLMFVLARNSSQLEAFARSYDFVQSSELGSSAFKMEIDGSSPPDASCSALQKTWGCRTRQTCYQTGGCDKVYGGSCDLCTQSQ